MTREEKQKAIDALKISAPIMAMTPEEFNTYIQTLNKVMDWLEQGSKTGHWVKMPLIEAGQTYSHECSLCGRRILITDVGLSEFPYCHCGAKMAESEDNE